MVDQYYGIFYCGFVLMDQDKQCVIVVKGGCVVYVFGNVYEFSLVEVCVVGCKGGEVISCNCWYMVVIGCEGGYVCYVNVWQQQQQGVEVMLMRDGL